MAAKVVNQGKKNDTLLFDGIDGLCVCERGGRRKLLLKKLKLQLQLRIEADPRHQTVSRKLWDPHFRLNCLLKNNIIGPWPGMPAGPPALPRQCHFFQVPPVFTHHHRILIGDRSADDSIWDEKYG